MPVLPAGAAQAAIDAIARHPSQSAKTTSPAALARANPSDEAKNFGALVSSYAKQAAGSHSGD